MSKNSLEVFTEGARLLAEADTIQKARELKSLALTAADWARRKGMGERAVQCARAYALDAERRMGSMLKAEAEAGRLATPKTAYKSGKGRGRVPAGHTTPATTAEVGLTRKERNEAEKLAALPEPLYEEVRAGEKSRTQTYREVREQAREQRRSENAAQIEATPELGSLTGVFSTILADPPWALEDEGDVNQFGRAKQPYTSLPIAELLALPVARLADVDAHLYLWITNRSLPKGFGLLEAWGFRYVTMLTWAKESFGIGNYFRGQTEHVLFGVRGSLSLRRKDAPTLLPMWRRPRREHSAKPVEFYDFVESCSPGPYLELFARAAPRPGWTMWGEAGIRS